MPFEIDWESTVAYKRFYGFVTAVDILNSMQALHNDFRYANIAYTINDFLDVQGYEISEQDILKFSECGMVASHSNPKVSIAVVTTDEKIRALVKRYSAPYPVEFFTNAAHARAWALPVRD